MSRPRGGPKFRWKSRDAPKIPCVAAPLAKSVSSRLNERISPSLPVHLASRDRSSILFPTPRHAYDTPFPAPSRRGHAHAPSRLTPSQRRLSPLSHPPLIARCFALALCVASPRRVPNDLRSAWKAAAAQSPRREGASLQPCPRPNPTAVVRLVEPAGYTYTRFDCARTGRLCYPTPPDDPGHRPSIPLPDDGIGLRHIDPARPTHFAPPSYTVVHDFRGSLADSQDRGSGPRH